MFLSFPLPYTSSKYAFAALDDYTKQKKDGIKDPVFYASNIKGLENIECWNDDKYSEKAI